MSTAEGNNLFVSYSFDTNACIFKTNVSLNTNIILNSKGMLKFSTKLKPYTLIVGLETIFLKFLSR